jgi:glutamyl-tRNA synthetase
LGNANFVICHCCVTQTNQNCLNVKTQPQSNYKDIGVLPEALLNYLGRMGWSMPDEREKFTLEMIEHFDIQRVSWVVQFLMLKNSIGSMVNGLKA